MNARLLCLVAILLLVPAAAVAQGWPEAFPSSTTSSWVVGEKPRLLVVGAGGGSDLAPAVGAITGALRNGGRVSLVMTGESLGDVAKLADAEIVARAKGLPVEQVVVVRVFDGGENSSPTAVATFYDKGGTVLSAMTAQRGLALAARADAPATTHGVSNAAAAAVDEVAKSFPNPEAAAEEFDQSFIGFDDMALVNTQSGAIVSRWSVPYQGKFKKRLEGASFYRLLGRQDLAASYESRSNARTAAFVGGGLAAAVGLGVMAYPVLNGEDCFSSGLQNTACQKRDREAVNTGMIVGGGLAAAGTIAIVVASGVDPHPVSPSKARELADKYNKDLKKRLGVTQVTPVVSPDGGGLAVAGRF